MSSGRFLVTHAQLLHPINLLKTYSLVHVMEKLFQFGEDRSVNDVTILSTDARDWILDIGYWRPNTPCDFIFCPGIGQTKIPLGRDDAATEKQLCFCMSVKQECLQHFCYFEIVYTISCMLLLEHWRQAPLVYYYYLFQVYVNCTLCVNFSIYFYLIS